MYLGLSPLGVHPGLSMHHLVLLRFLSHDHISIAGFATGRIASALSQEQASGERPIT